MFDAVAARGRAALLLLALVLAPLAGAPGTARALTAEDVEALAFGENDAKVQAASRLAVARDERAVPVLRALAEGTLHTTGDRRVLIVEGDRAADALTGRALPAPPEGLESVTANNRVRREVQAALAAYALGSADPVARRKAAEELAEGGSEAFLPALERARASETDPIIRDILTLALASQQLAHPEPKVREAAARSLAESENPKVKTLLLSRLERRGEEHVEPDAAVRAQIAAAASRIDSRLARTEALGHVFSGVSLGSILLLVALGLAITYGVMGVINMAHGELLMIGAYATYVVQAWFRSSVPGAFDAYLVAAVPISFLAAAAVGLALERTVIRWLYGRPLETLLATWGISLVLIQAVRTLFGAQNVEVANPAWLSGGVEVAQNLVLPWSRIAIIAFAAAVLAGVGALVRFTRFGLYMRAVTQNRRMAGCVGVRTGRVDALAFAFGSGLAGLAGCALSQIGNVGPDLGQGYIVDSFMVVVLGGVGQLAGTVYAALGLGVVNKFLEAWSGAVLAKIAVLVFIIVFIQKRPQGLFALKGRFAED